MILNSGLSEIVGELRESPIKGNSVLKGEVDNVNLLNCEVVTIELTVSNRIIDLPQYSILARPHQNFLRINFRFSLIPVCDMLTVSIHSYTTQE